MKLSQKQYANQAHNSTYFEQFKQRLTHQSVGFGLWREPVISSSNFPHSTTVPRQPVVRKLIRKTLSLLHAVNFLITRQRQKRASWKLLKLSDSLLRDICLNRADLKHALMTGKGVDELIVQNRKAQTRMVNKYQLVDHSKQTSDISHNHYIEYEKAA